MLGNWKRAGIATPEAARQEHEEHLRGASKPPMQAGAAPNGQGAFIRHNYTQDDYNRMVVDLDEEDN